MESRNDAFVKIRAFIVNTKLIFPARLKERGQVSLDKSVYEKPQQL